MRASSPSPARRGIFAQAAINGKSVKPATGSPASSASRCRTGSLCLRCPNLCGEFSANGVNFSTISSVPPSRACATRCGRDLSCPRDNSPPSLLCRPSATILLRVKFSECYRGSGVPPLFRSTSGGTPLLHSNELRKGDAWKDTSIGLYSNKSRGMAAKTGRLRPEMKDAKKPERGEETPPGTLFILPPPEPRSGRALRPLWRDLIMRVWGEDPHKCPCCPSTMSRAAVAAVRRTDPKERPWSAAEG